MEYKDAGVDYARLDPFKRGVLKATEPALKFPEALGIRVVRESLGEPAVLFDFKDYDFMLALKSDGVGTKSRIADAMYAHGTNGFQPYAGLGRDLVAMNANDLICVGATPLALTDEIAAGSSEFFADEVRVAQLLQGLARGCGEAKIAIPCGETPTLPNVVYPDSVNITGSSIGIVRPKEKAVLGQSLEEGDVIFGLRSNGVHANGLSLARKIAEALPDGYFTKFNGHTLGEELLKPTSIYARHVLAAHDSASIHYMSNITGSGFRKIARAKKPFTYVVEELPPVPEVFTFLQKEGDVADAAAFETWNMGLGFVIIAPESEAKTIEGTCLSHGARRIGRVEKGERKVVIEPKGITYTF